MELSVVIIYIILAVIVVAIGVIAVRIIKDDKHQTADAAEDRNILDALLDEIRDKEENDYLSVDVDEARQLEIEKKLQEEQERFADETRRLNKENEELKRQLEESSRYTKQLDMRHMQRAIKLAEQNKNLKEQISKLRSDFSTQLESEKKEFAKTIEEEKKAIARQYEEAHELSDTAKLDIEARREAFSRKMEDSRAVVAQQLDSTYEEVAKLVESERLELMQKHDIERLEIAQRNNSEKGAYRKMLADLNEENTALEKQLDEERLAYAQKLYEAKRNFEAKLRAEKVSNAKLVAAVAHEIEDLSDIDISVPEPEPVEVEPEVTITSIPEPEAMPYKESLKKKEEPAPKREAKLVFAEDGVVNLKLVMRDSVSKLETIVRKYGVGISLQFGEMADTIVYADSTGINEMVVSLVQDVASVACRNSTIVMSVKQLGDSKYGMGEYEYSCTYIGDPIELHRVPIDKLNGEFMMLVNDDGTKTVVTRFRFELR